MSESAPYDESVLSQAFSFVPLVERPDFELDDPLEEENWQDQRLREAMCDSVAVVINWLGGFIFDDNRLAIEASFSRVLVCLSHKERFKRRQPPQVRSIKDAAPENRFIYHASGLCCRTGLFALAEESHPAWLDCVHVPGTTYDIHEHAVISDESSHIEIYPEIADQDIRNALDAIAPCPAGTALFIIETRDRVIVIPCAQIAIRDYPFLFRYLERCARGDHSFDEIAQRWFFDGFAFKSAKWLGKERSYVVRVARDTERALHEVSQVVPRAIVWSRLHGGNFPLAVRPPYTGPVSLYGSFFDYQGRKRLIRVCREYHAARPQHQHQRDHVRCLWSSQDSLTMSRHYPIPEQSAHVRKIYLNRRRKALTEVQQLRSLTRATKESTSVADLEAKRRNY